MEFSKGFNSLRDGLVQLFNLSYSAAQAAGIHVSGNHFEKPADTSSFFGQEEGEGFEFRQAYQKILVRLFENATVPNSSTCGNDPDLEVSGDYVCYRTSGGLEFGWKLESARYGDPFYLFWITRPKKEIPETGSSLEERFKAAGWKKKVGEVLNEPIQYWRFVELQ